MDLVSIKAELKSWEKAFRSRHGRDPKKEDIKADAHIARQYKLYNNSKKPSTTSGRQPELNPPPRSSSRPNNDDQSSLPSGSDSRPPATGRHQSPSFSTPTKPSPARVHQLNGTPSKLPLPSFSNARSAPSTDNPFLTVSSSTTSNTSRSVTPQKRKNPPSANIPSPSSKTASSSFQFVNSPNKLKALISSYSPTKSPKATSSLDATTIGLTPRTKARKRLRGEITGETPQKAPRRTFASTSQSSRPRGDGGRGDGLLGTETAAELVDLLGPSPVKAEDRSVARPLFRLEDVDDEDEGESDGSESDGQGSRRPVKLQKATVRKEKDGPFGRSNSARALLKTFTQKTTSSTSTAPPPSSSKPSLDDAPKQPLNKRANPFLFGTTTESWDRHQPPATSTSTSNDPKSSRSRSTKPFKDNPSTTTSSRRNGSDSDSSSASPPPPPAKKPRRTVANGGAPRLNANQKAKSEAARKTLALVAGVGEDEKEEVGEEGSEDAGEGEGMRLDGGERGRAEEEGGQRTRIVRSRLMARGESGETRLGRAAVSGSQSRAKEHGMMEEDELGEEPEWDEQMEESLRVEMGSMVSPIKKKRASNGLYGLPIDVPLSSPASGPLDDPYIDHTQPSDDVHDPSIEVHSSLDPTNPSSSATLPPAARLHPTQQPRPSQSTDHHPHDLPPHLLSLLSLRSPESTSARLAKSRAETYTSIFAPPPPPPPSKSSSTHPPPPLPNDPKGKGKGRATAPASASVRPPSSSSAVRPLTVGGEKKRREMMQKGEVYGVGEFGREEEEEGDDDWASEVEGWKEGRFGVGDEEEDW